VGTSEQKGFVIERRYAVLSMAILAILDVEMFLDLFRIA
jgi:hypothetical protein